MATCAASSARVHRALVGKNEKSAILPAATAFLQRKTARSFVDRGFKEW